MITDAVKRAFEKAEQRGYDKIYWSIDLHGTVVKSNYSSDDKRVKFYPDALKVLEILSKDPRMKLILWTSTPEEKASEKLGVARAMGYSVFFDYFNENPDFKDDKKCDFSKKFAFDILLDDKAGFDPEKDWEHIRNFLDKDNHKWLLKNLKKPFVT